jgi:hypothetical protein
MEAELDKVSQYVDGRGGVQRRYEPWQHHWSDLSSGYYKALSFEAEYFVDGIIISLRGDTLRDSRYFVNPSRRSLDADLRSGRGVCLADIDEYNSYERLRSSGWAEQEPKLHDPGKLALTLEGAIRHLAEDLPDFNKITGLSKRKWPIPLQLSKCPRCIKEL